ncbi:helix-turn-helix domain-containing protein [Alkaliphilus transvaalensis]|uniref:helix-turn-helix domain-containing protein n=1 Tax=Alkaliphilus transvaalensis TaxID=114628 RepID=UPI0004794C65|nr:helix-turn-helix transcriptional regulator [Alkaliphilus transvaalensis]
MEILTPGEKVKKIRKELGLNQEDIASDQISKSLISMIEKNKRNLTEKVAVIIANNINKYYKRIGKEIFPEELMESEIERVQRDIYNEIEYLRGSVDKAIINERLFDAKFNTLMKTVEHWNLIGPKMELLLIRGEFYHKNYKYKDAIKDLSEALVYYMQEKDYGIVARIYNFIGICYYMLMLVDQALIYYIKAYDTAIENDVSPDIVNTHTIILNLILAYRKIERYDMALHYLNLLKKIDVDYIVSFRHQIKIGILEANTYRDLKNFPKAERMYNKLLQKAGEIENYYLIVIYDNLSILNLQCGNIERALFYINKAFKLINATKPSDLLGIILTKAQCEMKLGNISNASKALQEGLIIAKEVSMNEMIIDYHFAIVELYIIQKDYNNALNQLEIVEKLIMKNEIKLKINELYSFYGQVYCLIEEGEKAISYMLKIRKGYLQQK